MVGMLTPHDQLDIRRELIAARLPYRETLVVFPVITSGSNWESFTDSPYEITGAQSGQNVVTYTAYRLYARVKIVRDTTFLSVNQAVTGLEIGDYLMYFSDIDRAVMQELADPVNEHAYLVIDGVTLKPYNITLNGVGGTMDVFVHAKKFSPIYRKEGT